MSLGGRGLLLPAIQVLAWAAFLGLWTLVSIWDLKEKKILHRHLLWGIKFAGVCYLLMLASTVLGRRGVIRTYYEWGFYRDLFSYIGASLLVALAMWRARIWPAGDTKLFVFLSLIYPLMKVSGSFQSGWLFLAVLINIFVPATIVIFFQAVRYVWATRLKHYQDFMRQMSWRIWLDFMRGKAAELGRGAALKIKDQAGALARDPFLALRAASQWLVSMFLMAVVSCSVKDLIQSPLLRTAFCIAVLFLWSRVNSFLGRKFPWALGALIVGLLLASRGQIKWSDLWLSFSYLTVFSLFMQVAIRWTMGAMAGKVFMLFFLFGGFFIGMIPWGIMLKFPTMTASLPSFGWARPLIPLALMGAFFGLCYAFVRVWDDEDHPDIPPDRLLNYMILHHSFLKKLQEDEDFYSEHFEHNYADGLTVDQVEALKGWCARNAVAAVPLTTTMSFSHWIFFGYFITWLLGGHVLSLVL